LHQRYSSRYDFVGFHDEIETEIHVKQRQIVNNKTSPHTYKIRHRDFHNTRQTSKVFSAMFKNDGNKCNFKGFDNLVDKKSSTKKFRKDSCDFLGFETTNVPLTFTSSMFTQNSPTKFDFEGFDNGVSKLKSKNKSPLKKWYDYQSFDHEMFRENEQSLTFEGFENEIKMTPVTTRRQLNISGEFHNSQTPKKSVKSTPRKKKLMFERNDEPLSFIGFSEDDQRELLTRKKNVVESIPNNYFLGFTTMDSYNSIYQV